MQGQDQRVTEGPKAVVKASPLASGGQKTPISFPQIELVCAPGLGFRPALSRVPSNQTRHSPCPPQKAAFTSHAFKCETLMHSDTFLPCDVLRLSHSTCGWYERSQMGRQNLAPRWKKTTIHFNKQRLSCVSESRSKERLVRLWWRAPSAMRAWGFRCGKVWVGRKKMARQGETSAPPPTCIGVKGTRGGGGAEKGRPASDVAPMCEFPLLSVGTLPWSEAQFAHKDARGSLSPGFGNALILRQILGRPTLFFNAALGAGCTSTGCRGE